MKVHPTAPATASPARVIPSAAHVHAPPNGRATLKPPDDKDPQDEKLRATFQSFVGEALFGQLLKAMRKTVGKPAYFHGGRAEEIFQQQLDQVLAEKIARTSADKFSGPMFELFRMKRP